MMKFSIIVPSYNRQDLLVMCLKRLLDQDYPKDNYEIIVVDDSSKDNTYEVVNLLKEKNMNLKYFRLKNHSGQGIARNFGLRKAKGEIIAFTDDDCVVEDCWLKKIESIFMQNDVDVVGGSIVNPINRYIAWAQYILNFSSWFSKGSNRFVKDIPTANIAYLKSSIEDHYFSESLSGMRYEDSLYNFYLYKNNKKILFCPNIKVDHFTWEKNYGLKKFFNIQKKSAKGFVLGGYKVHEKIGKILIKFKFLNLFCPRLSLIFLRCAKYGYLTRFILCFPLILLGEFYKGIVICSRDSAS